MRILVTGNLGYIGTVLTPMLLDAGHDVVGYDSDLYRRCTFDAGGEVRSVPQILKDIRDVERRDVEGFDAVMHLAALSNDPLGNLQEELTMDINHHATVRLADLAKAAGVARFLYASSCSNYGASGSDDLLDETAEVNPITAYGRSKVASERSLSALAGGTFCPVYLRCATAYGVSPRMRFDIVLNNLVAWAVTTGKVHLKSDGTAWRPITHIRDISRAYLALLDAPRDHICDRAFNVGRTCENYLIRDLATTVSQVVPDCDVAFADDACADVRNYRVSCDLIEHSIKGYDPQWTAVRGAQELYAAYQKSDLTLEQFEGPTYLRIAHIQMLRDQGLLDDSLRFTDAATSIAA